MRSDGALFFQAEDGIRDLIVTGVQTCALPIFSKVAGFVPPDAVSPRSPGSVSVMVKNTKLGDRKSVV